MTQHAFTRRGLLQATGVASLSLGLGKLPAAAADANAPRPNILWFVSEDNNPWFGAYGDPNARTPHLDAFAKRSITYQFAYSTAPVCAPSRFAILTGAHAETNAPAQQMRATSKFPAQLSAYPALLRAAGYYCTNNDKTDYNSDIDPHSIWDQSDSQAHWRNRPASAPFMSVFNTLTTHERFLFKPTPGAADPAKMRVPAYLPDTPTVREDIASYYNIIEKMDAEFGDKLAELDAAGLADDTIIFYYADNGGILPRTKHYAYNEGFRCPLIVHIPPKWAHLAPVPAGSNVDTPVSFVDLAPTLLSLIGADIPSAMQGKPFLGPAAAPRDMAFGARDRMDERYDMIRTAMDGRYHYIRNYMPHRPNGVNLSYAWQIASFREWEGLYRAGKCNAAQSAFFEPKPFEELYDLRADPDQVVNLASSAAHGPVLSYYRRALDQHMIKISDNGFAPEGTMSEGYDTARDARAYPLRALMALAHMAASRDPRHMPSLIRRLRHRSEAMRYWAATGLLILKDQANAAAPALMAVVDTDPIPQVRVVAAEALTHMGEAAHGGAYLAEAAQSDDFAVKLLALNALSHVGDAAKPARAAAEMAAQNTDVRIRSAGRYVLALIDGVYDENYPVFDREFFQRSQRKGAA